MAANQLQSLEDLDWFHPNADRHYADVLLMQNGSEGSYLLRPGRAPSTYSLSVRGQDSVKHYTVTQTGNEYKFGMATFLSLSEFVDHFSSQPLLAGESGVVTLLKYPYPREVTEPHQYDCIRVHAQVGRPVTLLQDQRELSMGSKEGFLTKLGGVIKNWKLRWFVVKKNELRYFRDRTDVEPIRSLDLQQCKDCLPDTSYGHDYCFKLIFPWRTFYLRASSSADARDWVELIRWKLERMKLQTM